MERLQAAQRRRRFLNKDIQDAQNWLKSPVGEHKGSYLANSEGIPSGEELWNLGNDFYVNVKNQDVAAAMASYRKIQSYIRGNISRRKNPLTKSFAMRTKVNVR